MKRTYDSEKTLESIISVSERLFLEKGFDKTSMQDIVSSLGMSKGAIYHHFKSKDEILVSVMEKQSEKVKKKLYSWIEELKDVTAREKLIGILKRNILDSSVHKLDIVWETQVNKPSFIISNLQNSVIVAAPIISNIIREGNEDGSLNTDYPDECAEVFLLLFNVWCDPVIFGCDENKLMKRIKFVQQMMSYMGVDIVNDEIVDIAIAFIKRAYNGTFMK